MLSHWAVDPQVVVRQLFVQVQKNLTIKTQNIIILISFDNAEIMFCYETDMTNIQWIEYGLIPKTILAVCV